jgi:rubrerythrin
MFRSNKENGFDIIKMLELCRDIELKASVLYEYFADLYKNDPKISALWIKTSEEEGNHAKQFDLAIKLVRQDALESVNLSITEVEKYYTLIEQIYEKAKIEPPSLLEALKIAISTENLFIKLHMTSVATFTDFSYQHLFNAMMNYDKEHVETLTNAYDSLMS